MKKNSDTIRVRNPTTFCHCWKMMRRDKTITGYTDHDTALVIDGVLCEPLTGFNASEAKQSLGFGADTVDIEGAISSSGIKVEDISKGLLDGAILETFLVNWRQPEIFTRIRSSIIGKIKCIDGRFIAELESPIHLLDQKNGRYVVRHCDAELGDARCGVNISHPNMQGLGEVIRRVDGGLFQVSGLDRFNSGWFSHGLLTFFDESKAKKASNITRHFLQAKKVYLDLEHDEREIELKVGNSFKVVAGCDKSFMACKKKFNNSINFRGFPHVPGNDQAYGYANEDHSFDGGVVIP